MYSVEYSDVADRQLRKIPRNDALRIRRKVDQIAGSPYARWPNVTKLQCREGYRLRVGNWRIIYDLEDNVRILSVEEIGARGGIYR